MIFGVGLALEAISFLEENEKLQDPNYLYKNLKKHCSNGNIAKIKQILELPKDFNFSLNITLDGLSPLSSALLARQFETFNFLITQGAQLSINDLISVYLNEKDVNVRNEIINNIIEYLKINVPKDPSISQALYLLGCADNNTTTLMKLHETGVKPTDIKLCDAILNSSLDFPPDTFITPLKMAIKNNSHAALKVLADFDLYPLSEIETVLKCTKRPDLTTRKFIRQLVHRCDLDDLSKFPKLKEATNSVIANTILQLTNSESPLGQLPFELIVYSILPYVFPSQHYEKSFFFTNIQLNRNPFTQEKDWQEAKTHLMSLQK